MNYVLSMPYTSMELVCEHAAVSGAQVRYLAQLYIDVDVPSFPQNDRYLCIWSWHTFAGKLGESSMLHRSGSRSS